MMPRFESYAQNCEDVLLNRCFGGCKTGFYIDIGASEPTRHSVTYALYLMGWSGIALEPLEERWCELKLLRPRDINLNLAIGDKTEKRVLYRSLGRGGTSTLVEELGTTMIANHGRIAQLEVAVETLADVCGRYAADRKTYDLLKIDVEGAEGLVFASADFGACRPDVIIAEASANTPDWEDLLTRQGFDFVTYDGINRWYASADQPKLIARLKVPVNVSDQYLSVGQLGSPFANGYHPDQRWAASFGLSMIGALQTLGDNTIVEAYLERLPPLVRQSQATIEDLELVSKATLGRSTSPVERKIFVGHTSTPTVAELYGEFVRSDEFRHRRGRVIASI